ARASRRRPRGRGGPDNHPAIPMRRPPTVSSAWLALVALRKGAPTGRSVFGGGGGRNEAAPPTRFPPSPEGRGEQGRGRKRQRSEAALCFLAGLQYPLALGRVGPPRAGRLAAHEPDGRDERVQQAGVVPTARHPAQLVVQRIRVAPVKVP